MTRSVLVHQPCDDCGSSDAKTYYDDGHAFCYSCGKYSRSKNSLDKPDEQVYNNYRKKGLTVSSMTKQYVALRGLTHDTVKKYDIVTYVNDEGLPEKYEFKFGPDASMTRLFSEKKFHINGQVSKSQLFGQHLFDEGSAKAITICESPIDAASAYQMLGSKYPVVGVVNASIGPTQIKNNHKYIDSFEKIYICLDSDNPGQEAARKIATLFNPNKLYIVQLGLKKDANEYLEAGLQKEFVSTWWAAKKFQPKGVVSDYKDIAKILSKEDDEAWATYPFPTLQSMTFGVRPGEIVLVTAQEKVGKTEILRAFEHHILTTTDHNVGIIHLEEPEKRCVQGLVGYYLGQPIHLPTYKLSLEDQMKAYESLTKKDGRCHIYSHFGSDDPDNILNMIRYLVSVNECKFIFLDHISMLVSGLEQSDERQKLDYISTRLGMMTRELGFTLFLVSHVNDDGKTRGSRYIAKIPDLLLHLDRDVESEDPEVRNTTKLMIKGNRFASMSGPAGALTFNPETYRLEEKVYTPDLTVPNLEF